MYNSNDIALDIFLLQPYNKREKQFNLSPVSLWQWKSNCPGSELFLDDNEALSMDLYYVGIFRPAEILT